jgi:hypothetical protein
VNGAGASGAIFGVLGAMIAFFVRKPGGVPPSVLKSQLNSATIFVAFNLLNGARYQGIDNAAHLGGLAAGFIMGCILSRPLHADRNSRDWTKQWVAAAVVVCLVAGSVVYLLVEKARPVIRSLGGLQLGTSTNDLLRAKGQPIYREGMSWVYNSVDSSHNGVLTVALSALPDGVVRAIEFTGDEPSAPTEMPFLNGMSKDAILKKYAPMITSKRNVDDSVTVWFRNGVYVDMRREVVFRYGIFDTVPIGR